MTGHASAAPHAPVSLSRSPAMAVAMLGLPLVGATFFQGAFNLTEVWIFGQLADKGKAVAGTSVSDLVTSLFVFLASGMGNAAVAQISNAHGAGDHARERVHVRQALVGAALLSLLAALIGLAAGPIGHALFAGDTSREVGTAFLRVMGIGCFGTIFVVLATAILRARGDSVRPLVVVALMSVATLGLEAVLVLGLFDFPRYGAIAAAWVTVVVRGLCAVWAVWLIARQVSLKPEPGERFIDRAALRLQFRTGLESALQMSIRVVAILIIIRLAASRLSPLDDGAAFTALNLSIKVDLPALLIAYAWGGGVGPIVGMALGAQRPPYARSAAWAGVGFGALSALVPTAVVLLWTTPVTAVFLPDAPEVVAVAVDGLHLIAPIYAFVSVGIIIALAYNGTGDMRTPLVWDIAIQLVIQGALAWYLGAPEVMGAQGLFLALAISGLLQGLIPVALLARARWGAATAPVAPPLVQPSQTGG